LQLNSADDTGCNTITMEMMATFALPCGMLGVIFRFTNELTHGSRFDSKPIGCKLFMIVNVYFV